MKGPSYNFVYIKQLQLAVAKSTFEIKIEKESWKELINFAFDAVGVEGELGKNTCFS